MSTQEIIDAINKVPLPIGTRVWRKAFGSGVVKDHSTGRFYPLHFVVFDTNKTKWCYRSELEHE